MAPPFRQHVPAGTFTISKKGPQLLQAYLGTCVGLALHCSATGIGGLIHLLLPDPISTMAALQPEKYATTGIPIFIKALEQAGAKRESMRAGLAGGALVGPLTVQDLDLDIGGRTAEAAREILEAYDITMAQSETGGFFTCSLELNMTTGEFNIEPAGQNKLTQKKHVPPPSADFIIQNLNTIKPIPQVALKVLRMTDQPDYDIESVTREVRQDQVISARIMKLANSAMFAAKRSIDSLDHALVFLGQEMLVKLILSAAVQGFYGQSEMGYSLCKGGLYHHAIGCASISEALARKTSMVAPGMAYTAGLLHDIGKVVLDQHVGEAYPLFYRKAVLENQSMMEVESTVFGITHTQAGYLLASQWGFPPSLAEIIRYHHSPEKAHEYALLNQIVYLADLLMSRFNIGLELERMDTRKIETCFKALDLGNTQIADLVDAIPLSVFLSATDTV